MAQRDTVYITGLPADVTEDDIGVVFRTAGPIATETKTGRIKVSRVGGFKVAFWYLSPKIFNTFIQINIYRDRETGRPKGDAIVKYTDPMWAEDACVKLNGADIRGNVLHVEMVTPKEQRGGGSAG